MAEAVIERRGPGGVITWQSAVAFTISLALLGFLVTSFQPDFGGIKEQIEHASVSLLLLAFGAHYLSLVVRGWRWRIMLVASAGPEIGPVPSVGTCSLYLLLCWFVNAISWLRLGNVYRAYLVSKRTGGSVFWAIGTVVSERFLDLAAVLLMLAVAGALLLSTSESRHVWPFLATALAVTGGLVLVLIVLRRGESRLTRLVPPRLRDAYERFIASALASVWNRDLPVLLLLTLAGWGLEMARLWLVVLALHLHISPEMLLFVTFAQGLLISAPLTPGGLGVVEPGLTGVLLFAFARDQALSIALLDRSISYVSIVLIGTLAFGLYEVAGRLGNSSRRVLARRPTI